jgi:hypothetical protein
MCAHVLSVNTLRMNGLLSPSVWAAVSKLGRLGREGGSLTVSRHHVGDLDHRVDMRLGEYAFAPRALDIEAEDPERGECRPLALRSVRYKHIPSL